MSKTYIIIGLFAFLGFTQFSLAEEPALPNPSLESEQEKSLVDHEALVYQIKGSASIYRKDASAWKPLQVDEKIKEGDKIKTETDASVEIVYDLYFQNHATIAANTMATFESIEPTRLDLLDGDIYNFLDGLPSESLYEVSVPTAVAAIRGTHFLLSFHDSAPDKGLSVTQGTVHYFPFIEGQKNSVDPENFIAVESGRKLVKSNTVPEEMTSDEKLTIENQHSSARQSMLAKWGQAILEEAARQWDELKKNISKMALIKDILNQHAKEHMLTVHVNFDANHKQAPLVYSSVVGSQEEEKLSDSLATAREAYLGGSNPDEETETPTIEEETQSR